MRLTGPGLRDFLRDLESIDQAEASSAALARVHRRVLEREERSGPQLAAAPAGVPDEAVSC